MEGVSVRMKKLLTLLICSLLLITACSSTAETSQTDELTNKLKESEAKITALIQKNQQLENEVNRYKEGMEHFPYISNLSREFVQAHTTGDQEKISQMLSNELKLENRDNKLYVVGHEMEWFLYSPDKKTKLADWVIQGFEYSSDNKTMQVFIREFLVNSKGELDSPPTFLNLTFKKFEDQWKIFRIEFDV